MLDVRSVRKAFGSRQAVRGLSFSVARGEVVGLLGQNGAGKSTTLRLIAGALVPDDGDVMIAGHSVREQRISAQRALGYLPEGAPLYEDMTPAGFLNFMAQARGLAHRERRAALERAIAATRITDVLPQRIGSLSKGYRRRVGLAASILHDPAVLVLDEPMDGLDPIQKRAVRSLIAQMAPGRAILISTHTLSDVPAICQRALLLHRGQIIANDTPSGLAAQADDGTLEGAFTQLTGQAGEPHGS